MKILVLLMTILILSANTAFAGYVKNEQGVMRWSDHQESGTSIFSWSGAVVAGYAEGDGTLKIYLAQNNELFETYQGSLKKGKMHGKGIYLLVLFGFRYEGDFVDNKFHGKGMTTQPEGYKYVGDYVNGLPHGKGILILPNGTKYEGDFIEEKKHGKGVFTWSSGNRYEGDFANDKIHGKGKVYDKNGKILRQGRFENDKFIG